MKIDTKSNHDSCKRRGGKWTAAGLAAILGIGLSAFAFAAGRDNPGFLGGRGFVLGKIAELGVTPEQKAQIKAILRQHHPTIEPQVDAFIQQRKALHALITAEQTDEQAIRDQVAELAETGAGLAVDHARLHKELRAVATPEQIAILTDLRETFQDKHQHMRNRFKTWLSND